MKKNSFRYIVLVLFVAVSILLVYLPGSAVLQCSIYVFPGLILLFSLILPIRSGLTFLFCYLFLLGVLEYVNRAKIGLTEFPLTVFDLQIAAHNPSGLFNALGLSTIVGYSLVIILALVAALPLIVLFIDRRVISKTSVIALVLALLLTLNALKMSTEKASSVILSSELAADIWTPNGVAAVSEKVGILPFLIMTYVMPESSLFSSVEAEGNLLSGNKNTRGGALPASALHHRPNIVFMLLESTFDVNRAFEIAPQFETALSSSHPSAMLSGPLSVNTVGGGTWMTEFEVITGLDWRWFGVNGFYTHTSIAPFMTGSFATYLAKLGYQTIAYYPVEGEFYGAQSAYKHYGFAEFIDGYELGFGNKKWEEIGDDEYAKAVASHLEELSTSQPFFAFLLTINNHSPHPCDSQTVIKYKFKTAVPKGQNCELNVYLERFAKTEKAVNIVEKALKEEEGKTKRPYVLVVFGDHMPHTFIGNTTYSNFDYSSLLRQPTRETFYQIRTSLNVENNHQNRAVPATFLAHLVSTLIATPEEEIYLPELQDAQAECDGVFAAVTASPSDFFVTTESSKLEQGCAKSIEAVIQRAKRELF